MPFNQQTNTFKLASKLSTSNSKDVSLYFTLILFFLYYYYFSKFFFCFFLASDTHFCLHIFFPQVILLYDLKEPRGFYVFVWLLFLQRLPISIVTLINFKRNRSLKTIQKMKILERLAVLG